MAKKMKEPKRCECGCEQELDKEPVPYFSEGKILTINPGCHPDFVGKVQVPLSISATDFVECSCSGGWDLIS
jgi:hypothetical protein